MTRSKRCQVAFALMLAFAMLAPSAAGAAACCGGGFSLPSLLTGDDRAQMTTSLATSTTAIDVQPSGKWLKRGNPERSETLKLEGAALITDLWQAGGSVPITRRARSGPDGDTDASGIGDVAMTLAYEAMPEWDYSSWRPKGVAFLQLVAPTGRARLESSNDLNLDVTGRGFFSVGPGLVLIKLHPPFDFQFLAEAHRSLARDLESSQAGGRVHLEPGNGATISLSAGWSKGELRLGLGALASYEDAISVQGASSASGNSSDILLERYATVTASAAYLLAADWATSAAYSDQSLLGSPTNTTLSRSVVLSLQRRWAR
jgi:hypothetical protein